MIRILFSSGRLKRISIRLTSCPKVKLAYFFQIDELEPDFLDLFGDRFKNQSQKMDTFIRMMKKQKLTKHESVSKLENPGRREYTSPGK